MDLWSRYCTSSLSLSFFCFFDTDPIDDTNNENAHCGIRSAPAEENTTWTGERSVKRIGIIWVHTCDYVSVQEESPSGHLSLSLSLSVRTVYDLRNGFSGIEANHQSLHRAIFAHDKYATPERRWHTDRNGRWRLPLSTIYKHDLWDLHSIYIRNINEENLPVRYKSPLASLLITCVIFSLM